MYFVYDEYDINLNINFKLKPYIMFLKHDSHFRELLLKSITEDAESNYPCHCTSTQLRIFV